MDIIESGPLSELAAVIQLAIAPVFLLAGIGALLNVVTARLGRAVDRARFLERESGGAVEDARVRVELGVLDRRVALAQRSIGLLVISALLVCLLVAALFLAVLIGRGGAAMIAVLFVSAMAALIGGLALFLAETAIATRQLRVNAELLMRK